MNVDATKSQDAFSQVVSLIKRDDLLSQHAFLTSNSSDLVRMFLCKTESNVSATFEELQKYSRTRRECDVIFNHYRRESLLKVAATNTVIILPGVSAIGNVIVFKVGSWNPSDCSIFELSALLTLLMESVSLDEQKRKAGYSVIYDLKGVGLKHLNAMRPAVGKLKLISTCYLSSQCKFQLIANAALPAMLSTMMNLISFDRNIKNVPYPKFGPTQARELADLFGLDYVQYLPADYGGATNYDFNQSCQTVIDEYLEKLA